jgi:hypothetical protein
MRSVLLSCLILASGVSALNAQQAKAWIRGPAPSVLYIPQLKGGIDSQGVDTIARAVRPTHWKKGLLIGGLIGTVGLGFVGFALCGDLNESGSSCFAPGLGGAALGAVLGGTVGALIGGQFPMRLDAIPAPDSTAVSQ